MPIRAFFRAAVAALAGIVLPAHRAWAAPAAALPPDSPARFSVEDSGEGPDVVMIPA